MRSLPLLLAAAVSVSVSVSRPASAFHSPPLLPHLHPSARLLSSPRATTMSAGGGKEELLSRMSEKISASLGRPYSAVFGSSGLGGGGGASVGTITDANGSGEKLFCKRAGLAEESMLRAEYLGLKEMSETNTVRVPRPVCFGTSGNTSFAVFEYLNLGGARSGGGASRELGRSLARMHRCTSANGQYGFHVDNTCGATPQPNEWMEDWVEFWDKRRFGHMLKLCARTGAVYPREKHVRAKVKELLSEHVHNHNVKPSLIHGDLWTGNVGFTSEGVGTIFDPATYYGDRESDIAMTMLFGSLGSDFYNGYNEEWPIPPGFQQRKTIYNVYHILNHEVLFGGGYFGQACNMMDQILGF